jgi:branched-chain amino acid transport system ATP-binding protein
MLRIDNLTVAFAGLVAVSDVSMAVAPGSIHAVLGPNGAGKTTLFNTITGYVRPSAGRIRFEGAEIASLPPWRVARRGIRRTFQNGGAFAGMTVLDNVLTGLHQALAAPVLGSVLRLPGAVRAEQAARRHAMSVLARLGLRELADQRVSNLSFGEQRMVEIARALVSDAKLLLLDEPAVGLSPPERQEMARFLKSLAASGLTVMLVEHVIELVMSIADRITVLHHGERIAEGTPEEIRADRRVLEVYLGA